MSDQLPNLQGVQIKEVLGQGAFGKVYRAHHLTLDVDVAVKVISASAPSLESALQEARLMARLDHPNLLRIHDAGHLDSAIYLILELMDGSCENLRLAPAQQALDLTRQLLSGLQALHDARILHRDIKPANCLKRTRDNRIKLADLGIAVEQATQTEKIYDTSGTLPFMAPELFDDPPHFSPASDVYALGLTLACMFLESEPFPVSSRTELLAWIMSGSRPKLTSNRPDIPAQVNALVERMCSARVEDRPKSAAEALAALTSDINLVETLPADESRTARIGPWILGAQVYRSSNWSAYVVTHMRTGTPARLSHLQPGGPLAQSSDLIIASAERASRLSHPKLLEVFDWGINDGRAYVVTAPQGRTLQSLVESGGPLDELVALEFAHALADGLAYLHGKGFVYQIVDPGSTVITQDARSAQLSWPVYCVPVGTPAFGPAGQSQRVYVMSYAAPEVINGGSDTIDFAIDIYGLGVVLFYLLAGRLPHLGKTAGELIMQKMQGAGDVRRSAGLVTAPTARLIGELLQPDPANRPASTEVVRDELANIIRRLRAI